MLQGKRVRTTRVDPDCGAPVEGNCSTVVTEGVITVAMTDNVEPPDEFKEKNAGGRYCFPPERSDPLLNWIETVIQFCGVDPELFEMMTGSPLVLDANGEPVGFGTDSDTYATGSFALELWTGLGGDAACVSGNKRYGYMLLPFLKEGADTGAVTYQNNTINFTITTITKAPNSWGVGPYDVVLDGSGLPSPLLTAIPTQRHRQVMLTELAPPDAVCGCQPLVIASS